MTLPAHSESFAPPAPLLKKTALNATHRALKAKMVEFGGWDMPVEYPNYSPQQLGPVAGGPGYSPQRQGPGAGGGVIAEHMAVRTAAGLFDVSHMGEIHFTGAGALQAVQQVTMNDAARLQSGHVQYSALLTSEGTFVDDLLVYCLGPDEFLLVVNAANIATDFAWILEHTASIPSVRIADRSDDYSLLAVQGPRATATLAKLTTLDLTAIKHFGFAFGDVAGVPHVLVSRTGYTGEEGFELYLTSEQFSVEKLWNELLAAGAEFGIRPCGLGARNTLRLEAGMPLYGHDISSEINVFEAGLEHWLKLDKGEFIGRQALADIKAGGGPKRRIAALEMVERGIARDGYPVLNLAGSQIGLVTSGSPAPFLKKNIALALLPATVAASGEEVLVQLRSAPARARQVPLPFYKRPKAAGQ